MSYVFSKALQETAEEKEQRLATQRKKWAANRAATFDSGAKSAPPPVATKPKLKPTSSFDAPSIGTFGSHGSNAKAAFRKTSLPARSYSLDVVETGPKMGGTFAKLAAKMEDETPSSGSSGFYRNKFEEYKAKRSLELHGCLPSSMRSNEQRRKYSFDKDSSSSAQRKYSSENESVQRKHSSDLSPPQVLPKPRRPSAENKRNMFAKNRSMTSPTMSTSVFFGETTSSPNKSRTSSSSSLAQDVLSEEFEQIFNSVTTTPVKSDTEKPRRDSSSIFDVNPQEIELAEKSPQVIKMKEEIALEKTKLNEAKEDLSQTIAELEQFDFGLSINGKLEDKKDSNQKNKTEHQENIVDSDASFNQPGVADSGSGQTDEASTPQETDIQVIEVESSKTDVGCNFDNMKTETLETTGNVTIVTDVLADDTSETVNQSRDTFSINSSGVTGEVDTEDIAIVSMLGSDVSSTFNRETAHHTPTDEHESVSVTKEIRGDNDDELVANDEQRENISKTSQGAAEPPKDIVNDEHIIENLGHSCPENQEMMLPSKNNEGLIPDEETTSSEADADKVDLNQNVLPPTKAVSYEESPQRVITAL